MAQQTLDFVIAQQVTGQAEVAKLIKSVGALDAEMKKLRAATAGIEGGFTRASGAIRGNTNVLDAQSEALRNQRQGMQQAGMQINDFATSVSTGASPVQAFNQQIGQLGFAMSMMQGRAATVGRFLAGPWSILIIGASMLLGQLFDAMSNSDEPSDQFAAGLESARDALFEYKKEIAGTRDELISLYETKLAGLQADFQEASTNAARFGREAQDANKITNDWVSQPLWKLGMALWQGSDAAENYAKNTDKANDINAKMIRLETTLSQMKKRFASEDERAAARGASAAGKLAKEQEREAERLSSLMGKVQDYGRTYLSASRDIGKTANKLADFNQVISDIGQLEGGQAFLSQYAAEIAGIRNAIEQEGALKALEKLDGVLDKILTKDLSPLERGFKEINEALENPELVKLPTDQLQQELDRVQEARAALIARPFEQAENEQRKLLAQVMEVDDGFKEIEKSLLANIATAKELGLPVEDYIQQLERIKAINQQIDVVEQNREIQRSYEAIGQSVADGFRGMITGAQSFGDAMRGIINSVIQELFRLFVVQQIVGMVSGALGGVPGGIGGTPAPTNLLPPGYATGGYPAPGKPAIVGERGPELFVPTGSGKIIPNHQLSGGGGTVINVDARGATSPEMVRQQVQQGILEAAPSIVAAAEQRTISTLRRPRLAGVM